MGWIKNLGREIAQRSYGPKLGWDTCPLFWEVYAPRGVVVYDESLSLMSHRRQVLVVCRRMIMRIRRRQTWSATSYRRLGPSSSASPVYVTAPTHAAMNSKTKVCRPRSSDKFGGRHFCPENYVSKINKMPKFCVIFARKISKIPQLYMVLARRMPEFYIMP